MKLYEIAGALAKIEEMSEDDVSLVEFLDGVQLQLNDKVNNIIKFERNLEASAEVIDSEIKRLTDLRNGFARKASRLKDYISFSMQKNGIEKIETEIARLSFRKSETLEVTDPSLIPEEYKVTKTTVSVDKLAVKQAIKDGKIIEGAYLQENKNLQIK